MIRIKLTLLAFCLLAVAMGVSHMHGFEEGLAQSDNEAFNAYTDFAKKLKHETHHAKAKTDDTVWAALNNKQ